MRRRTREGMTKSEASADVARQIFAILHEIGRKNLALDRQR